MEIFYEVDQQPGDGLSDRARFLLREASTQEDPQAYLSSRERQLLSLMPQASLEEQEQYDQEILALREALAVKPVGGGIDLTSMSIQHVAHSTQDDWTNKVASEVSPDVTHEMMTQATLWFDETSPELRADKDIFADQAMTRARRVAGKYGEQAGAAYHTFLQHVGHLAKRYVTPKTAADKSLEEVVELARQAFRGEAKPYSVPEWWAKTHGYTAAEIEQALSTKTAAAMVDCQNCGATLNPAKEKGPLCPECGQPHGYLPVASKAATETFHCDDCGAEVEADANFCPKCGYWLGPYNDDPPGDTYTDDKGKIRKRTSKTAYDAKKDKTLCPTCGEQGWMFGVDDDGSEGWTCPNDHAWRDPGPGKSVEKMAVSDSQVIEELISTGLLSEDVVQEAGTRDLGDLLAAGHIDHETVDEVRKGLKGASKTAADVINVGDKVELLSPQFAHQEREAEVVSIYEVGSVVPGGTGRIITVQLPRPDIAGKPQQSYPESKVRKLSVENPVPQARVPGEVKVPRPTTEEAFPWELDDDDKGAADVANVPTPGGAAGYPQPKTSMMARRGESLFDYIDVEELEPKQALKYKDLPSTTGTGKPQPKMMCTEAGEEHGVYSADGGDYFMANGEDEVTCSECGAPMQLVEQYGGFRPVSKQAGYEGDSPMCGNCSQPIRHDEDGWVHDETGKKACPNGQGQAKRASSVHTAPGGTHPPYNVRKDGDKWKVVNDIGETKGTHDTEEDARQQQKALYANVPGASKSSAKASSCPKCGSRNISIQGGSNNSTHYKCKDCGKFFQHTGAKIASGGFTNHSTWYVYAHLTNIEPAYRAAQKATAPDQLRAIFVQHVGEIQGGSLDEVNWQEVYDGFEEDRMASKTAGLMNPPCPHCKSTNTGQADKDGDGTLFFCGGCGQNFHYDLSKDPGPWNASKMAYSEDDLKCPKCGSTDSAPASATERTCGDCGKVWTVSDNDAHRRNKVEGDVRGRTSSVDSERLDAFQRVVQANLQAPVGVQYRIEQSKIAAGAIEVPCRICGGPTGGNHGYFKGACHKCVEKVLDQAEGGKKTTERI